MAILRIKLRGQKINDLILEDHKEYFAGRKESSDIVLQAEKGISRDHFVLKKINDEWVVEILSKYSSLIVGGDSKNQLTLKEGVQFSVPPYDFEFKAGDDLIGTSRVPMEITSDHPAIQSEEEKTFVGVVQSLAYLKVMDANLMIPKELLRLEYGESWVAGRDEQCQILISDQRVSRKQFEIRKKGQQYFIVDLGSVNGTLVNGTPVQSNIPVPLKSGDAITVLDNLIFFELHDPNFKKKIESIQQLQPYNPLESLPGDSSYQSQVAIYQSTQNSLAEYNPQNELQVGVAPGVVLQSPQSNIQPENIKKKMFYVTIAAIVLVAGYFYSEQMNEENEKKVVTPINQIADPISKLTPEQQAFVRQTYELSLNYLQQGKYQLAQQEVIKLKDLVPSYKDSQEIERMAAESLMIIDEQRKAEQQAKLKQENEDKIQRQANVCSEKINEDTTMDELDNCLTNVIEFGPLHPRIVELKSIVEKNIAAKQLEAAQKAAAQAEIQKLVVIYKKAQSTESTKNPFKIMDAYDNVVKSKLPDPGGLKSISKSKIEKIRQTLASDTKRFQLEAEKLYQAQDLKGAIIILRKALLVNPTNMELRDKTDQWINELRKQMMAIYQEGILEESFGNVEGTENKQGAKDKWKKILNLDIPDGEYYLKSQIKIKKYGAQ